MDSEASRVLLSLLQKVGGVVSEMSPENIVMIARAGSYIYNLAMPQSDIDYIVIYKEPTEVSARDHNAIAWLQILVALAQLAASAKQSSLHETLPSSLSVNKHPTNPVQKYRPPLNQKILMKWLCDAAQ